MTTAFVAVASAALVAVAAWGILRPFGRHGAATLERLADPLEDERRSLLRALEELEDERASGALAPEDYGVLRAETEMRAVAVLRALEETRGAGTLAGGLREIREVSGNGGPGRNGSRPSGATSGRMLAAALIAVAVAVATVPLLAAALRDRREGEPITGAALGAQSESSLSFFQRRVQEHPGDVAARLDLAQRYLQSGDLRAAVDQYRQVLELDPANPEAHARLGLILLQGGRPDDALREVDLALAVAPEYSEAHYLRGVILLKGLGRPEAAADAFRAYLEAAPFGGRRAEVSDLLREAQEEAAAAGSEEG